MRAAGELAARILGELVSMAKPGVCGSELLHRYERLLADSGALPPVTHAARSRVLGLSVSVNNTLSHGVPHDQLILAQGDIATVDVALRLRGYHADTATTVALTPISRSNRQLISAAREVLAVGVATVRDGVSFRFLAGQIATRARVLGFTVVPHLNGHGIGRWLHQRPTVMHTDNPALNSRMRAGQAFTIEPVLVRGLVAPRLGADGTSICARVGQRGAYFEHTVLVRRNRAEVLTLRKGRDA